MKRTIVLLVILILVLLGGYYATGVLTERTLKNNIATINDPNNLALNFAEYHRGWFTSTAILETKLHIPPHVSKNANGQMETTAAQDFRLPLPMTIYHGPIIFSKDGIHFGVGYGYSVIKIPPEYQAKFDEIFTKESQKPKLDVSIFVSYLNRSTLKFGIPAFNAKIKENNIKFDWKGMTSSSLISEGMNKLKGDIAIEGFHAYKENELDVKMGNFDIDYNLKKIASGLYLGPSNLSFDSFTVKAKDNDILHLSNFDVKSDCGIDDNLFYASLKMTLDKIQAKNKVYGPGKFNMEIKNLDSAAILKIHQQVMTMQETDESQQRQQLMAILPEVPALLSQGPELEISQLEFTMPEGDIKGHLKLFIPKEENSNPLQMIQKLQGNGRLSMPGAVLKTLMLQSAKQKMAAQPNTQQVLMNQLQKDGTAAAQATQTTEQQAEIQVNSQLANLTKSGVLVIDGANYVIEFELKEGKLIVNGKPFTPSMMQY